MRVYTIRVFAGQLVEHSQTVTLTVLQLAHVWWVFFVLFFCIPP